MHPLKKFLIGSPLRVAITGGVVTLLIASAVGFAVMNRSDTYDFSQRQKISSTSPFRLQFPEEMNHASVEERLSLPEGLQATKKWDGETLILMPAAKLEAGKTYALTLDGRALKANSEPLGRDLTFTFTVTGAPVLSAQIPGPNSANVPTDAEIMLVFDRPVVPLTQVQGGPSLFSNWPVTISPAVKGRWRWLGTTTAVFEPSSPLVLSTKYTVTVPAGIDTISGDKTEKDFSWTFETERPAVESILPSDGSADAGPNTELTATFTHEMDLKTAKDFISLGGKEDNQASRNIPIKSVKYGTRDIGYEKPELVQDKHILIFNPESPLKFKSSYVLTVKPGIRGTVGELGSATGVTVNFATVGDFRAVEAANDAGGLHIDFTSFPSMESLAKNITFSPEVPPMKETEFYGYNVWSDNSKMRVDFYPQLKASTTYTMKLQQTLTDVHGQKLVEPFEYKFTTAELPPRAFVHPEEKRFNIFEAGKTPVYFLNALNVSKLDLKFGRMSFEKFATYQENQMNSSVQPVSLNFEAETTDLKTWSVDPKLTKNEWKSIPLDLEKEAGKLQPGIYALSMKAPEWVDPYTKVPGNDERFLAVTNMGITLKFSHNKALVWVTNLQTGEPVSGATIKFRASSGAIPVTGTTDKEGFFSPQVPMKDFKSYEGQWMPRFWVTAEKGNDFAFIGSDWNSGIQPYDFGNVWSNFRDPNDAEYNMQTSLYTERPLYGAGDTVYFKGIARLLDKDGALNVPQVSTRSAVVTVTDTDGTEVYKKTLKLTPFGGFSDSFVLSEAAPLGMYFIQASITPDSDVSGSAYSTFSVLAYRKPEYKVVVSPEKEEYFNNETAKIGVSGQYYFGAPMASAKVDWRLVTSDYYFNKYTDGWYSFALQDAWCWMNCASNDNIVTQGAGKLDASGMLNISEKLNIDEKPVSQVMTLEADLTDQNNQVVSSRTSFVVHKSGVYVGVNSNEYGVQAGDSVTMNVITLKTDGTPAPNRNVGVKLFSRKWNTVREKGVDGEYYYNSTPEDTFIRNLSARTNEQGKGTVDVQLDDGGEYQVVVTAQDDAGLESSAGWSLYAWADAYYNWPQTNNDRIDVVADKPEYKAGETAKLIVKSPYQGKGVKALVTVERENIISKRVIDVTSNALPIEVPITEDLVPTVYVSVVIMKPRMGETFNENGLDTGAPRFKMGYAKLNVDTSTKKLDLEITTDAEKYAPGQKVTATIVSKDSQGNPVQAEVSLGVVDMSLLDLTGFQMPDILSNFYYERGLGVQTANMLIYLMERFKPGSKGGGGDGEDKKRGVFKDTAYWNPTILTDKDGRATISFTLPDNLTTWHFLAIGSTKDNKFGAETKTVIETKKVILRPVRPRFAVVGDKITLGAIVHNYLDKDQTFTVTLQGDGFSFAGNKEQKISVPKDGNVKIDFPVVISDVNSVKLRFTGATEGAKDDIEETIPVFKYGVLQSNATAGVTEDQVTEGVFVPTKKDAANGTLTVSVAPSLGVYLPEGLDFLATFPYGCAEQTASSFAGNVALKQLEGFDQFNVADDKTLQKNIETGLQKLYTFQHSDGGFMYFAGSYRSYPYLTAYILHVLKLTSDAGYFVDRSVIERAKNQLKSSLATDNEHDTYMDDSTRAYSLFVLSEHGSNDVASLNTLFKKRTEMSLFSRAYLAMAYKKAGNQSRAEEVLQEIINTVKVEDRGAHFEESDNTLYRYSMSTDVRTTAIALQAIARILPDHELAPRIVRGLLSARRDGHWDTTQSTTQAVLAFVEYMKATDELNYDYQGAVEFEGKKALDVSMKAPALERKEVTKVLSELSRGKQIDVKVGKNGQGKLYYDIGLEYFFTPDKIEPTEQGIGILREMTPLTKADSSGNVGTTQKVTLTITVPETRNFVAVESMLPAGMEPIDMQFATSQQTLLENAVNSANNWQQYWKNQTWRFSHVEFRDDRIFLFAEELPPGVYRYEYLVRATTPGTFRLRPAKVWEMYFPETFGQTDGGWMQIGQ